jgi:hypothetical protein
MLALLVFLANFAATWFLCGLIWFVQVVHYPAFCDVGAVAFPPYHARHARRTTAVVVGPMVVELATALLLAARPTPWMSPAAAWGGLALVAVVWASTFALQVPMHRRLGVAFADTAHRRLCATNWIRTAAWTARAILLTASLAAAIKP